MKDNKDGANVQRRNKDGKYAPGPKRVPSPPSGPRAATVPPTEPESPRPTAASAPPPASGDMLTDIGGKPPPPTNSSSDSTSPGGWAQGRSKIDRYLQQKRLQEVAPNRSHAEKLLELAQAHTQTASMVADDDPEGAFAAAYDGARKALVAILANQGLRPTSKGGHVVVGEAVTAQLDPPHRATLRPFDRMRERRNKAAEYPDPGIPPITPDEVRDGIEKARKMIDLAHQVLDQMPAYSPL